MASAVSKPTGLGDSKHGGALFTLPREIRDEIYRLLVKGSYLVFAPSEAEHGGSVSVTHPQTYANPDLVILLISQAISREAQDLLYSESVFRYSVDFYAFEIPKPPIQAMSRIQNLKISIGHLMPGSVSYHRYQTDDPTYRPHMAAICEATIGNFTGVQILRNTFHIRLYGSKSSVIEPLANYIFPKLNELNGFRAILVEVYLGDDCDMFKRREQSENMGSNEEITADIERVKDAIKDAMEPTLGPATTSNTCFNTGFKIYLEFHPREHVPTILRAQAQKLMLDADRLEQIG